ncbi:hypothetical protein BDV40DRAFT_269982 [Aspergillus tamarii]|uniref:Uncharacterized protein n=1 Tax=Aspergillus tamarii TaxID=41984 RepID=A0A5N6UPT8_ASPTM|nr:hypothetical protein BDV40DRAFT_269982 [Aspergillus tamarii]
MNVLLWYILRATSTFVFWIITMFAGAHVFGDMPYVERCDGNDGSMRAILYYTLDSIQGSWGYWRILL